MDIDTYIFYPKDVSLTKWRVRRKLERCPIPSRSKDKGSIPRDIEAREWTKKDLYRVA